MTRRIIIVEEGEKVVLFVRTTGRWDLFCSGCGEKIPAGSLVLHERDRFSGVKPYFCSEQCMRGDWTEIEAAIQEGRICGDGQVIERNEYKRRQEYAAKICSQNQTTT